MGDFATLTTARGVMTFDPADKGADFRVALVSITASM